MEIHFKILILIVTNAYFIYYRKIHSILISLNKSNANRIWERTFRNRFCKKKERKDISWLKEKKTDRGLLKYESIMDHSILGHVQLLTSEKWTL